MIDMNKALNKYFKLEQHGTNIKTEVLAGITTFLAMAYILVVNPAILSAAGIPFKQVFMATVISAVVGTLFMRCSPNTRLRLHRVWVLMLILRA